MPTRAVPEVSEPSRAAVDPCAAARCAEQATTSVVLRLGGEHRAVRCCSAHGAGWAATARVRRRADLAAAR